jgi:predicted ATPase
MFIRRVRVSNFMVHKSTSVDLYPVTVFVGSNNGGKSALFNALLNFSMVSRGKLSQAFNAGPYSFRSLRYRGASSTARIGFEVELSETPEDERRLVYTISYAQTKNPGDPDYVIYGETLERRDISQVLFDRADVDSSVMTSVVPQLGDDRSLFAAIRRTQVLRQYEETDPLVTHVAREISRMNKFRLIPGELSHPSPLPETLVEEPEDGRAPRVGYEGKGLASVLYYLAEIGSPVLDELTERLRKVLDRFEGFEFNKDRSDQIGFSARFSDARGVVAAANLSDGTLTLIGTLALLLSPTRPPILCLEEPENGLTPRSTAAIYGALVDATAEGASPRSQILISSHSPFVICDAWNGDERDFIYQMKVSDGASLVRPFDQIIKDEEIQLRKVAGERRNLGLEVASQIMDGYYS